MTVHSSTSGQIPVSCYIRTCNEARTITRVVEAALQVVSEVIVIDSGSTDETVTLARAAGARVVTQSWLGNGMQKRAAEEYCQHDWLLDLDADEVVSLELADELRQLFASGLTAETVYQLPLTTVDPGGRIWHDCGVYLRAKLYNKTVIRMPAHLAWDQLQLTDEIAVVNLKSPLLHYAFFDVSHLIRKQDSAMTRRITGMGRKSRFSLLLRIYFALPFYFLKYFLLRSHWKVGAYGMAFSLICAFSRWGRDMKLYERDWVRKIDFDTHSNSGKRPQAAEKSSSLSDVRQRNAA